MQAAIEVTPAQLPTVLLNVAVVRPLFIWGAPGIGKSALVRDFAASLGLDCVSLVGTQLAPEDLIGVPQLVDGVSRFCPPEQIARDKPYLLFLDELNASSPDVQKAFYSLILDRRIGSYTLPQGSIVIGAGNRATDNALARPMASALINRMLHVHLRASAADWLAWAGANGVHPWVVSYLTQRPDHLWSAPPKTEEPFSTPRSWHMLSDALLSYPSVDDTAVGLLAHAALTPAHASAFRAYTKTIQHAYDIEAIVKGHLRWPNAPGDRDLLYFLAEAFRVRLLRELPTDKRHASNNARQFAHRAKSLLVELSEISLEIAQLVVAGEPGSDSGDALPAWFLAEAARDIPRLVAGRAG